LGSFINGVYFEALEKLFGEIVRRLPGHWLREGHFSFYFVQSTMPCSQHTLNEVVLLLQVLVQVLLMLYCLTMLVCSASNYCP